MDLKARVIHLEDTKSGDARDVPLSSRAVAVLGGLKHVAVFGYAVRWMSIREYEENEWAMG